MYQYIRLFNHAFEVSKTLIIGNHFVNFHKLIDNKHKYKSIEAIGQKSGYSSKYAFFKAFKDYTGITPQEYQKLSYTSSKL